jgi:hypothetical protein
MRAGGVTQWSGSRNLGRLACGHTSDGWTPANGAFCRRASALRGLVVSRCTRRLFLAGDAAHSVPPTSIRGSIPRSRTSGCWPGAWTVLYPGGDECAEPLLRDVSAAHLEAQRFSARMTSLMHPSRTRPSTSAAGATRLRDELAGHGYCARREHVGLPIGDGGCLRIARHLRAG